MYKEPGISTIKLPVPKVAQAMAENIFVTDEGVTIRLQKGTIVQEQVMSIMNKYLLFK